MLSKISQVHEEFFRIFQGIKVPVGDSEKSILCRYAKKSSEDYTEEQSQQVYPCIALLDYSPTPREEWFIDMREYFGGKSVDGLTGYLYQNPIWMNFKYDVSIVSKKYSEFIAMQDYFMEHFVYGKRFIFNKRVIDEYEVGDVVPYSIRETDIPRTDGVHEKNYEFTLAVWLYPKEPREVELIQAIILNANGDQESNIGFIKDSEGNFLVDSDGAFITSK